MQQSLGILMLAACGLFAAVPSAAAYECRCRAPGLQVEPGQTACLATPKGYRLATCGFVLNNTAWHFSDTPCVVSRGGPAAATEFVAREAPRRGG